jgi:hypothetical protein
VIAATDAEPSPQLDLFTWTPRPVVEAPRAEVQLALFGIDIEPPREP